MARQLPDDPMLTVAEVCTRLRIDRSTYDRMYIRGNGPRRKKVGGTWRTRESWLNAWIDADDDERVPA